MVLFQDQGIRHRFGDGTAITLNNLCLSWSVLTNTQPTFQMQVKRSYHYRRGSWAKEMIIEK